MFPILPFLILLLLGPAKAERLADEGRLPAAWLAFHRAMAMPTVVVASIEETPEEIRTRTTARALPAAGPSGFAKLTRSAQVLIPSAPPRAGPTVA